MKTHGGTITRDTLLIVIANMVIGFVEKTKVSFLSLPIAKVNTDASL